MKHMSHIYFQNAYLNKLSNYTCKDFRSNIFFSDMNYLLVENLRSFGIRLRKSKIMNV